MSYTSCHLERYCVDSDVKTPRRTKTTSPRIGRGFRMEGLQPYDEAKLSIQVFLEQSLEANYVSWLLVDVPSR